MFALHAGFSSRRLIVWGEVSGGKPSRRAKSKAEPQSPHPNDAGPDQLLETLAAIGVQVPLSAVSTAEISLPSVRGVPIPSSPLIAEATPAGEPKITRWNVTTAALESTAALELLSLCVNKELLHVATIAGLDLTYWTNVMRFVAALAARQQFLPDLTNENGRFHARWRAAFIGRDQDRRRALVSAMPPAARALTPEIAAETLLDDFLDTLTDELVRTSSRIKELVGAGLHDRWLAALHSPESKVAGGKAELHQLQQQVRQWRKPIAIAASAPYRLCFRLEEPEPAPESEPESAPPQIWHIQYLFQSRHDPSLLVSAETVWKAKGAQSRLLNLPGFQPREHLLFSLGQASAICPRIEESLKFPAPDGYELDAAGAHDFLTTKALALEEAGFGVMLPRWWSRGRTKARLSAGARIRSPFLKGGDGLSITALLDFNWEISIGGEAITLAELRALAAMKAPLVKFRGQWMQVNAEEIQAALEFWKKKGSGQATAREVLQMALGATELPGPLAFSGIEAEGWIGELIQRLQGHTPFEETPVPEGLRATLRPYQVRGFSWLAFLSRWGLGACLADDMGLGKTIQTLSLIQSDWPNSNRPILLLCPTSVIGNWQREAARFTPQLPVMVHHGLGRTRGDSFVELAQRQAIVLSSYTLLHRDFEHLKEVSWGGVVLDEAQNIKNPETKQAVAARALTAGYRVALTGTPVENNVGDLWSIMDFLNPGLLGTRAEFKRKFFLPIQSGTDEAGSAAASAALKKATGPFILRRLKTDQSIISDLPQKLEMKVFCTLTKEQASLYAAVVNDSLKKIESSEGIQRKGLVLATLSRLKQICNHPAQFLGDNSPLPARSGKLSRLTEMLEEAISVGDRVLIFSQFAEMGEMLRSHLQETFGREALFLHGGVPKKQRDRMVERFQDDPNGPPLFILSLKAGGTGLNLTRASHVFHFDRWWNPAVENQATDRAFRIGQKKNVQVHKFVCAGTMEERIDEMIEQKTKIAAGVLGAGEGWLTELSTTDLRALFALQKGAVEE